MARKITPLSRRAAIKKKPKRIDVPVTLAEQLLLASFACACGAEIDIAPDGTLTTELVCTGCGEWIGIYAELIPAPAQRARVSRSARSSPRRKPQAKRRS
jgi:hypothetical protein